MKQLIRLMFILSMIAGFSACGDKKDSAERAQEAQRAMQEGAQKERAMMEGMQKGVENMEKKMAEQKEATKK
jgi:predicted small lipoprotein YifL